jgi:hypothetical protein
MYGTMGRVSVLVSLAIGQEGVGSLRDLSPRERSGGIELSDSKEA